MADPYENQLLGGFIYALGIACGRSNKFVPTNLFQQTPLDSTFSDLVVGSQWCYALEFKRERGTIDSERAKWSAAGLEALKADRNLRHASRRAHILCYGKPLNGGVDLACIAYAAALGLPVNQPERSYNLFIKELIANIDGPATTRTAGLPPADLECYLRQLAALRKQGTGERESTWLAVMQGNHGFSIRTAPSLAELLDPRPAPDAAPAAPSPPAPKRRRGGPS